MVDCNIGASIDFNPHSGLFAGIVGQRYLFTIQKEDLFEIHPWRVDMEIGVRYFPGKQQGHRIFLTALYERALMYKGSRKVT